MRFQDTLLASLLYFSCGCTSLQSISVSDYIPSSGEKLIKSSVNAVSWFRLSSPNLSQNVLENLKIECRKSLSGIQSTLTLRDFLFIQLYTVDVDAYCSEK